jgi:hypothetical protein
VQRGLRTIAWVSIFSNLFIGCYSSALVDPTGSDGGQMYSGTIEFVVTKDGTKHLFDIPATVVKNAIVGTSNGKPIAIPLADITKVYVTNSDTTATTVVVVVVILAAALLFAAIAFGGLVAGAANG